MKDGFSKNWRSNGEAIAFDHGTWEFKSRHFYYSARQLLTEFDSQITVPNYEVVMHLMSAVFLSSLAIELICKAYFLKSKFGPREQIFTHSLNNFLAADLLNDRQLELLVRAEQNVVWAGRYPTPIWKKELAKENYDVPVTLVDGIEHIDAMQIPTSSSRAQIEDLMALYAHIHSAWHQLV